MDLPLDSADALVRLQEQGEVTAREIAEAALARIERTEPVVGAFVTVDAEGALSAAEAVDRRRRAGESLGPLAGVPVAVKDAICTRGLKTTCSSRMLEQFVPPYDATVVTRLRAADAVIVGKTNMDEFAMGASTETSAHGLTRNPWDPARTPGGSSGGAAAAVAAGCVPLSIGSDTGGSIRQPAAFCGVTGMKPTYGRVSRYGLVAFASSLDQIGPIATDVADTTRLLQAIAGFDPADSTSIDAAVPDYSLAFEQRIAGMRIGLVRNAIDSTGIDPAIAAAVDAAASVLTELGATVEEVQLPHAKYWVPAYYVIAPSEASSNLARYDGAHFGRRAEITPSEAEQYGPLVATYCRSRSEGFGAEVKRRIMLGTYALSAGYYDAYYLKALQVRRLIRGDFDAAFQKFDLLLGPVSPSPAFPLGEKLDDPLQMYLCDLFTVGANLAGIPAMSLPAGFTSEGLPIGIQLQAPLLSEQRLLSAGAAFQTATDWHTRRASL